ncbi:MAG: DUF5667 domain-containing protein [Chloroflexota bacterium]|nr:DUF5667 domain-containing protein [Chloroflexota bacterium]
MKDMLPRPEPRDAFKRALRAQLMAQAPTVLAPRETAWSRFGGLMVLRPAFAAALVVVILAAGAGRAAAGSLPGDLTYPLKSAAESLQLAFAPDDTTRLQVLAELADHRLAELTEAVSTRPAAAPTATDGYAAAIARFTAAVDALRGKPGASIDTQTAAEDVVDAAHDKHEAVLDELQKTAPAEAQDGLDRARKEADKLHPSDKPARPREGDDDRTRTPQPARTVSPARASETPRGGEPTRTATPSVRR